MKNKKKTTGKTETAGKTAKKDRVVLALSTEDAKMLSAAMQNIAEEYEFNCQEKELATKIYQRIQKTLNNQEAKELGYPRGMKQMLEETEKDLEPESVLITAEESNIKSDMEMPDDVMEAIAQATEDAEQEIFISDEDRAMQVNTEIRPEPEIISDRRN